MKIVVNTPSGRTGRVVADRLLNAQENVVIISREPTEVEDLVARGARLVGGSIDEPLVLDAALKGADALFWVTPFVGRQDFMNWARRAGRAAAAAAARHHVNRAVLVSSVGAQHESGVGPVGVHLNIEASFRAAISNVTSLRAGHFMENYLIYAEMIACTGTIVAPYPAGKKIPMVATRDIGEVAVRCLCDQPSLGFRILGVHGPEDLDQIRAAAIIGEGIGRSIEYIEQTVDEAKQEWLDAGTPGVTVDLLGELYAALRDGRLDPAEPRTPETTTNTSLLQFSREVLKPLVEAISRQDSRAPNEA